MGRCVDFAAQCQFYEGGRGLEHHFWEYLGAKEIGKEHGG
jgi:hypothetical protein